MGDIAHATPYRTYKLVAVGKDIEGSAVLLDEGDVGGKHLPRRRRLPVACIPFLTSLRRVVARRVALNSAFPAIIVRQSFAAEGKDLLGNDVSAVLPCQATVEGEHSMFCSWTRRLHSYRSYRVPRYYPFVMGLPLNNFKQATKDQLKVGAALVRAGIMTTTRRFSCLSRRIPPLLLFWATLWSVFVILKNGPASCISN